MRVHPQAQARTSEEEADRRTAEVEADTRKPAQEADRRTAGKGPGSNIPVQVVDSRRREVGEYSISWATSTHALSAASERSNRTWLTRF
jgi:hypothetical protein